MSRLLKDLARKGVNSLTAYICQPCRDAYRFNRTHPGTQHLPGICDCRCRVVSEATQWLSQQPTTMTLPLLWMQRGLLVLSCTIPGKPLPCPRPRVTKYGTYYSDDYVDWKNAAITEIRQANIKQNGNRPIVGAVECGLKFWGYRANADLDNLAKSVLDAAQAAGVLVNDKHVVHMDIWKMPAEKGVAKTELEIRSLQDAL